MSEELSNTIRSAVNSSGKRLPTIAKKTGVAVSALTEFMDGADIPNDSTPGTVNQADYNEWRSHFGQTAGSGSVMNATVPEPATLAILLAGMLTMSFRRR